MTKYIERNLDHALKDWLRRKNRKPLIIRGARQTGKSTLVRHFAKSSGLQLAEIDIEEHQSILRAAFQRQDLSTLLQMFERISGVGLSQMTDHTKVVLFLDEIQAAPSALQSLRYFYEKLPNLPVVAAGSTLEFVLNDPDFSVPVGRVDFLALPPLSFKEYLLAAKRKDLVELIEGVEIRNFATLSLEEHREILKFVRSYFFIGGMPESVAISLTDSLKEGRRIRQNLIAAYRSDLQKYPATAHIRDVIREQFDRSFGIIGKNLKYSQLAPGRTARDVRKALKLLVEAGVLLECIHSHSNGLPLMAQAELEKKKLYFLDIALLLTGQGLQFKDLPAALEDDLVNEGELAEQFVAQELRAFFAQDGEFSPLVYWRRGGDEGSAEVDFVIAVGRKIIPIEVKAGSTGSLKSLREFCLQKNSSVACRLNAQPPSIIELEGWSNHPEKKVKFISLPIYLASELHRICDQELA